MKRMTIAFALIASASAAPAFADQVLAGTTISTMGEQAVVSLHPGERGIGVDGIVEATRGQAVELPAANVLTPREQAYRRSETVTSNRFRGSENAATAYGAR